MNRRIYQTLAVASMLVTMAGLVAYAGGKEKKKNKEAKAGSQYTLEFKSDGSLIRPAGWREWVYVGTPLTPNSLNGGAAGFPEFHSVYIDPDSWAHWKKTGEFREGTIIAKELALVGSEQAVSGKGNGEAGAGTGGR